jgi:hypothetical protein
MPKLVDMFQKSLTVPQQARAFEEQETPVMMQGVPHEVIKDTAVQVAQNAPEIFNTKISKRTQRQIVQNIEDPEKQVQIQEKQDAGKKLGIGEQFSNAILSFMPQLVGMAVGGAIEGGAGAAAGFEGANAVQDRMNQQGQQQFNMKIADQQQAQMDRRTTLQELQQAQSYEMAGKELGLKEQGLGIERAKLGLAKDQMAADLLIAQMKEQGKTGLNSLAASQKKDLAFYNTMNTQLNRMVTALSKGVNLRTPYNPAKILDPSEYEVAAKVFLQDLGRLKSQGAITADEVEEFSKMIPAWNDSDAIREQKVDQLNEMIRSGVSLMGVDPAEVLTSPFADSKLVRGSLASQARAELANRKK